MTLTKAEARKRFGLKQSDGIDTQGVKQLIEATQKQLGVWSLSDSDREELLIDLAAYNALLS